LLNIQKNFISKTACGYNPELKFWNICIQALNN
jgi:hypothetical protein